jgi:hypothetical protein
MTINEEMCKDIEGKVTDTIKDRPAIPTFA